MNLCSSSRAHIRPKSGHWLTLAAVIVSLSGCATKTAQIAVTSPADQPSIDVAMQRPVQAVALDPTGSDGQASWIIEPDVPRIPKVAGLETQLPPHIARRMSYAFDLAQRGATYSANGEFRAVLGLCALELDAKTGGAAHREALRQGLTALDEADEFSGEQFDWRSSADVRRAAAAHVTPIFRQSPDVPTDAVQAAQAYYTYAEQRMAAGCQGMPAASLAFYGLGRTLVMPGLQVTNAAGKAALLQRVALQVSPQNVLAGNELGVLLAQHGHLDEAERLFEQCVATNATPEAWRNLSVVYARKGNDAASRAAQRAGDAVAAQSAAEAAVARDATPRPEPPLAPAEATESQKKPSVLARWNVVPELPKIFRR